MHERLRVAADTWADDRDLDALAGLFAPTASTVPGDRVEYIVAPMVDRVGALGGDVRYESPTQAWSVFRVAGPGMALLSTAEGVTRRIAEQRASGDVRFLPLDEAALSGPATIAVAAEWRDAFSTSSRRPDVEDDSAGADREAHAVPRAAVPRRPVTARPSTISFSRTAWKAGRARCLSARSCGSEHAGISAQRWKQIFGEEPQWRLAYVGLALIAVALTFVLIRVTFDDSYITWRYGKTFVSTGHWNWNPTGPRVEAYSNPLYAALSVIGAVVRVPAELFFKFVSLAIVAAYVVVVRRLRLPRRQEFLLLAAALASPVFFLQLYGGLETALFALLIAVVFGMVYRRGGFTTWGFVAAFALALSRPEGIAFAAVAMIWAAAITQDHKQVRGVCAVLGAWGVYWLWRWQHFGYFFPNPYYVKSSGQGALGTKVVDTATTVFPVLGLAALIALVYLLLGRESSQASVDRVDRRERLTDLTPVMLALLSAVMALGLYKHSTLVMDPGHRFYWQVLIPVALVVLCRPLSLGTLPGDTAEETVPIRGERAALVAAAIAMGTALAWQAPDLKTDFVLICAVLVVLAATIAGLVWRWRGAAALAVLALVVGIGYLPASEALTWVAYRYRLEHAHEAARQGHRRCTCARRCRHVRRGRAAVRAE